MVKQIAVSSNEHEDTLYLLDDTGQVFQGWQEPNADKSGRHWVWKLVELPDALKGA